MRYRPGKGRPDSPAVRSFPGAEFVGRMAALILPARQKAGSAELEAGDELTVLGQVERAARQAVRASARAWAACLKRIFEVSPVLCVKCSGIMILTALIQDDRELDRVLAHQGWPASDWPA